MMRAALALAAVIATGCSAPLQRDESNMSTPPLAWPSSWADHLGKTVTVAGKALDAKLGAMLAGDHGGEIWIDGLDAWPEAYRASGEGDAAKRVRVTGKVIERYDLPVFVEREDEPQKAGMPVRKGTDLRQASHRYLLQNARWELVP